MWIKEALAWGAEKLSKIKNSEFDAAILLAFTLKKPKEFLYTYPEKKLTPAQAVKYKNYISRRAKHEPVAYITGKKEFYGFEFLVSPAVLIPRPDTEALITAVINATMNHDGDYDIMDVGTGSGAIAITLKKLLPKTRVFASDISPRSLALAKKNARLALTSGRESKRARLALTSGRESKRARLALTSGRESKRARRLGAKMTFLKGNLLSPFKNVILKAKPEGSHRDSSPSAQNDTPLIITANLPYLSRAEWQKTAPEVKKYEPYGALVGGKTGTEIYEKLFGELYSSLWKREAGRDLLLNPPQSSFSEGGRIFVFIEIGHNQKPAIAKLAQKILHPQKIEFFKDLADKWRVAKITM